MSKGCVLLPLWEKDAVNVIEWAQEHIPQEVLADDGFEREPHVTGLYGFDQRVDPTAVCDALVGFGKVAFRLGKVSRFESEKHDVLKVDVEGESLHRLNQFLRDTFEDLVEVTYPDYHPHLTLAYVQKGACKELDGNCHFDGMVFVFDQVVYSSPGSAGRYIAFLDEA